MELPALITAIIIGLRGRSADPSRTGGRSRGVSTTAGGKVGPDMARFARTEAAGLLEQMTAALERPVHS
jgi:hypothetical protein